MAGFAGFLYLINARAVDSVTTSHAIKNNFFDFAGGPVTKTPDSQCRGPGFNS